LGDRRREIGMRGQALRRLRATIGGDQGELRAEDAVAFGIVLGIDRDAPLALDVLDRALGALHEAHRLHLLAIGLGVHWAPRALGAPVERERQHREPRERGRGSARQAHRMRLPPLRSMSSSRTSTAVVVITHSVASTPWRSIQFAIRPGMTNPIVLRSIGVPRNGNTSSCRDAEPNTNPSSTATTMRRRP